MKLLYIANARMPTEKAHGIQITKMCEAFAREGEEVTLCVPKRKNVIKEDIFAFYGVEKNFSVVYLPVFDFMALGFMGFLVESLSFAYAVRKYIKSNNFDVVYGRDEVSLFAVSRMSGKKVFWEAHTGQWNFFVRKLISVKNYIVSISQGLKDFYIAHGVEETSVFVAHDGVDLGDRSQIGDKESLRDKLNLPRDVFVAMYAGKLGGWKGVGTLLQSSLLIDGVTFVIIGGDKQSVENLQKKYPHVVFMGFLPYRDIALYEQVADVLVIPNSGKDIISRLYTSPLKLFSYMASGVPMIASDLPSIREVLTDDSVTFAQADNPESFALAIRSVKDNKVLAQKKADKAKILVENYTWAKRAQAIISFIHGKTL